MSVSDFNDIFSRRLRYYLSLNNMTQFDLSQKLKVGTTSVSNWCQGLKTPRMDKVDAMCAIFNCRRRDLMEDPSDESIADQRTLSLDESALLDDYQKLNTSGRQKVREYAADLTEQKKYTQDTGSSEATAG